MKKVLGAVCMGLGVVLLIGALTLFLWNRAESEQAEKTSAVVIPLLPRSSISYSALSLYPSIGATSELSFELPVLTSAL